MSETTLQDFREHLAEHLSRVADERDELVVTREAEEAVVVIARSDLSALRETLDLLSSPPNAERLLRSVAELEAGKGVERLLSGT